jgi:hypothetical protein
MEVEVDQREVGTPPVMVLGDAAVADLVEAEDTLQDAEGMFYLRSNSRLGRVLSPGFFIDIVLIFRPTAGPVLGMRSGLTDRRGLALIAAIASHLALLAVQ